MTTIIRQRDVEQSLHQGGCDVFRKDEPDSDEALVAGFMGAAFHPRPAHTTRHRHWTTYRNRKRHHPIQNSALNCVDTNAVWGLGNEAI